MASDKTVLFYGPGRSEPSALLRRFIDARGLEVMVLDGPNDVHAMVNRTLPACIALEGTSEDAALLELVRELKADSFTGIVPLVVSVLDGGSDSRGALVAALLEAGADEVVEQDRSERESLLRLEQVLRRADRDVSVHPTTRLPGTNHIARDMERRIRSGEKFAVCYADLDHFKEFNDRYGYQYGDAVIGLLARILRDVVRGLAPGGFVGHIGGDDFIFNIPVEYLEATCDEIIRTFDELIPYQYTEDDRKAGYFLGKDRRGNIHRIPIMALSIGVVTNQYQDFDHPGMISELAAEMKTYAKSLPGSKYVVDRRHQSPTLETAAAKDADALARRRPPGEPAEANQ